MERLDLYRCEVCGNLVEVIIAGQGELVCCGQPMKFIDGKNRTEMIGEKHIPVFIKNDENNYEIRVGQVPHPMIEEHHIMFIEAVSDDRNKAQIQYLYPGEEPKMFLHDMSLNMFAREFCNIHGLWEAKND